MELSKTRLGIYSQLSRRKMREKHGLFIVEGRKAVLDTAGRFEAEALIVAAGEEPPAGVCGTDRIFEVSSGVIGKISSLSTPPAVIAIYRIPDKRDLSMPAPSDLCILLDGIQDPGNLGTIVRTAHWFGVRRIYASHDTADLYNPKVVQATMGSLGKVAVEYCDLSALIDACPEMPVYGTLLDGCNIYEAALGECGFIVMGNEGKGISPAMRERIDRGLLIPPYDACEHSESLNVAVATAVVLSQFRAAEAGMRRGNV